MSSLPMGCALAIYEVPPVAGKEGVHLTGVSISTVCEICAGCLATKARLALELCHPIVMEPIPGIPQPFFVQVEPLAEAVA